MRLNTKFALVLAVVMILSVAVLPAMAARVTSIETLMDAKVGVQAGTNSEEIVKALLSVGSGEVATFKTVSNMVDALKARQIDAAVMDEGPARYFAMTDSANLRVLVKEPLSHLPYAIAFRKGYALR